MLTALCISLFVIGAADGPQMVISDLLPQPQQLDMLNGTFRYEPRGLDFILKTPSQEIAARLSDRLKEVQAHLGTQQTVLNECPVKDTFGLIAFIGEKAPPMSLVKWPAGAEAEGYDLTVSDRGVVIAAASERGLFYGMMTMEQLLASARVHKLDSIPCLHITDWPKLGMRGFHEDYGRDQLPTVEDHKREIRLLAQYKMNTHFWFIEPDHFVYKFDPEIGKDFDRFTFDEIRDVVAYAKQYYIEVIPVVELLAHMENTLNNPKYAPLTEVEGSGTLCPTSEEAFQFVKKIVDEVAPTFDGRYFHCGLDESAVIGKGRSAEAVKSKGIERVYADYYTRLNNLVKLHGKTMMMYADIVLNHPNVMKMLPKDIVMMYWNYSDAPHYDGFDKLAKMGFKTTSLSGIWDWVNLYPLYSYAFHNIDHLAAQSVELNSLGTFTANWGDGFMGAAGANLSEYTYYGAIYATCQGWKPQPIALDDFSRAFAAQFFGIGPKDAEAFTLLARCQGDTLAGNQKARRMLHSMPKEQIAAMAKASEEDMAFWRNLKGEAARAHILLKKSNPKWNADYLQSHDLAARVLVFAADLALQYRATAEALAKGKINANKQADAYQALLDRQVALWPEYRDTYAATNKPINLRYLVLAWEKSGHAIEDFVVELKSGELPKVK